MEDWFRWVIGLLVAAYTAVSAWVVHLFLGSQKEIAELKIEIAVLKSKPQVDPLVYTEAVTTLTLAVKDLAVQIVENARMREQHYKEFKEALGDMRQDFQKLASELRVRASQRGHGV